MNLGVTEIDECRMIAEEIRVSGVKHNLLLKSGEHSTIKKLFRHQFLSIDNIN